MNEMHIQKDIGSFSPALAYQPTEYMYSVLKNMVYSHNESAYIITQKHIDDTMQTKSNIKCGIEAERRSECCFCFCCTITKATATPWNMSAVLNVHTYVCATDNLHTRIPIERVLQFDWVARLYAKSRKKADRLTSIREKCLVIHTSVLFINVYFLLSLLPGEGTRCECVSQFHCGCIAPTLSTATYTHTHVYKQGKRRYKK